VRVPFAAVGLRAFLPGGGSAAACLFAFA